MFTNSRARHRIVSTTQTSTEAFEVLETTAASTWICKHSLARLVGRIMGESRTSYRRFILGREGSVTDGASVASYNTLKKDCSKFCAINFRFS